MHGFRKLIVAALTLCLAHPVDAGNEPPESIAVKIDEARLIRLDQDAAQIIVGNPSIADVDVRIMRALVDALLAPLQRDPRGASQRPA